MRLMIVDDHVLFRESLVSLLNNQPDIKVVGEAGTATEAISLAEDLSPDLILMDIGLPDYDGLEAARIILSSQPNIKIVMLTIHEADDLLFKAISSGAKGYLLKNMPVVKLLAAVRALERGEAALSRTMTSRIIDHYTQILSGQGYAQSAFDMLTPRELDVLRLLADGADNSQIAKALVLTENTVKVHVHNILKKLNVHNRRQAANYAEQRGLMKYQRGLPPKLGS